MPPDNIELLVNEPSPGSGVPAQPASRLNSSGAAPQLRSVGLATLVLTLCFVFPLWKLIRLAASSELYSYVLLIPFISIYLVWLKRKNLSLPFAPSRGMTASFLAAATVMLIFYGCVLQWHMKLVASDCLALLVPSYLLFFFGLCSHYCGRNVLRAFVFPLAFLIFMVPIPAVALGGIDSFLQYGSAAVADGFFTITGTSFLEDGLVFQLPGITIQIAPECSGIHSSLVLFITSVLASYFFLRTPWKRAVFILAVVPLGILRNGFRVFTIGELCIHIGPQMINSPIHHKGGPIFFVLSLIPLFILLVVLQRSERAPKSQPGTTGMDYAKVG
jgi:exosortase C (VPDSG-CTERM-specific)